VLFRGLFVAISVPLRRRGRQKKEKEPPPGGEVFKVL